MRCVGRLHVLALLAAYGALVVALPEVTVSPGDMIAGHESIADQCFRCHTAFRGTPPEKCISCHEVAAIGLRFTTDAPIVRSPRKPTFHQALLEPSCTGCHSDHIGAGRPGANAVFTHALLRQEVREACVGCHADRTPDDALHRAAPSTCGSCHGFAAWTPATFDHAALGAEERTACVTCHADVRPGDLLHRQAGDGCASCHGTRAWKPATFDHAKYFRFDRHHPPEKCTTCHPTSLERYTCYGCHEHTPQGIAREHREEGITDFKDCVRCHRSAAEDAAERAGGSRSAHDD